MTFITGNAGCPCIDNAAILSSLSDRHCILPDGETTGVLLTLGGSCVPFSYGSSSCRQHDLLHDPACSVDKLIRSSNNETNVLPLPGYCFQAFCYVDEECKTTSDERVYRSSYFPVQSGVDMFYSYSTCNATADDWFAVEDDIIGNRALGGIDIAAAVPTYVVPMIYKRDAGGEILTTKGDEYLNDDIPFEGVYVDYVNKIVEISGGDINTVAITHRSRASSLVHPTSSFTAAVQDIKDGLVDMGIGPFWITGQRLKMTAFTLPIVYDKTYLVIPKPQKSDTLNHQVRKVVQPFSIGLWGLILGVIAFASLLSVWFGEKISASPRQDRRAVMSRDRPRERRRVSAYARLCLDQYLQKGLFFCSAGVEQDDGASLPSKLLLFGFGFFILISVSAYVANLAAFLTLSGTSDTVKTMEDVEAKAFTICAHPALKTELEVAWPDAKFYFHEDGNEFSGVMDDYEDGKCQVLAIGYEDTSMDLAFLERMCENDLVYTTFIVAEIPVAFPIRSDLAAGFSYWMVEGQRLEASLQDSKDSFSRAAKCNVHFSAEEHEGSEYDEITVKNMFFPTIFFAVCAVLAMLLQMKHIYNVKKGGQSLVGRQSTLSLTAEYQPGTRRSTIRFSRQTQNTTPLEAVNEMVRRTMKSRRWLLRRQKTIVRKNRMGLMVSRCHREL